MLTSGAPTSVLLRALRRAGWGPLSGAANRGLRGVLEGLAQLLDDVSGMGEATAWQIAEASGYSERWTRDRLYALEAVGILVVRQGGIREGGRMPSWYRIQRTVLVAALAEARDMQNQVIARRREEFVARMRGLRQVTVFRRKSQSYAGITAGQVHAALNTDLLSYEEPSPVRVEGLPPSRNDRKDLAGARTPYERADAGGQRRESRAVQAGEGAAEEAQERKPMPAWVRAQFRELRDAARRQA